MSGITDTLAALADVVEDAVPEGSGWQVHAAIPQKPVPPCILLRPGAAESGTVDGQYWTDVDLVCIVGGADQPSALEQVAGMLETVAGALNTALRRVPGHSPTRWAAPGVTVIGNQTHMAAVATVTVPMLEPEVNP
jgi:hypothetical protein